MVRDVGAAGRTGSPNARAGSLGAKSYVQSVDRALDLLQAVAAAQGGPGGTVPALAEACHLNRSTAWRILSTLEARHFVISDRLTGRYSVGGSAVELARAAGDDVLVRYAHATLETLSLQTGEWAAVAIFDGTHLVCVDEANPPPDQAGRWVGQPILPMHTMSCGKAFLAFSSPDVVESMLDEKLERFTDSTVTDHKVLRRELQQIRRDGYAVCRGEYLDNEWGVAAPVLGAGGRPIAVLALWGPADRGGQARFTALGELAREAAQRLSLK